jgi:hypothetical protein
MGAIIFLLPAHTPNSQAADFVPSQAGEHIGVSSL